MNNRTSNNNRSRQADGSGRTSNTTSSTSNPTPNGRFHNSSRENNPFHRNNNRNSQRSDTDGYRNWKNKQAAPPPPQEKVLVPQDFPALPTVSHTSKVVPSKTAWVKQDPEKTLALRIHDMNEKEEEARRLGRSLNEEEDDKIDIIPLSSILAAKYRAKQREERIKQLEMEEEEANYRWQISRAMFPPKKEPEVPVYDENADIYDEEIEAETLEAEEAPQYEERI